jgi:hypothetical protein
MQADEIIEFSPARILHSLSGAVVTPTVANRAEHTFTGCVYDRAGRLVPASQRTHGAITWKPADPEWMVNPEISQEIEGQGVYLGHYTGHYGHFLIDTLARFWVLQTGFAYDKLVFQPFVLRMPDFQAFSPLRVCCECFGVKLDDLFTVRACLRFKRLAVPTMLFEVGQEAKPEQALVYRQIADYCASRAEVPEMPTRLYLSRSRLKKGHKPAANEAQVEQVFESFGFTVVYPEQLDFAAQVALYRRAEVMAGFGGSAMHNSLFMREGAMAINLGSPRSPNGVNRNQKNCDRLSKVRSEFVPFRGEVLDEKSRLGVFDAGFLREALQGLL